MQRVLLGAIAALCAGTAASAAPILQFDVNGFSATTSGAFGTSFTGTVTGTKGANGILNAIVINPGGSSIPTSLLNVFNVSMSFVGGNLTTGTITQTLVNGNSYSCTISPGTAAISTFVGGGFKIEALTKNGAFSALTPSGPNNLYGGVNVNPWFLGQGGPNGLPGSLLQFNFAPSASTASTVNADMDLFVDVAPLPPAAWAGLATLGGAMMVRRIRRGAKS